MKRIVALAFWALWARESLTVGHHRIIFGMEEKGGPWGSRKRTNQSELDGEDVGLGLAIDRKSTRLNSSHRCISYAVFCLLKKKKFKRRMMAPARFGHGACVVAAAPVA